MTSVPDWTKKLHFASELSSESLQRLIRTATLRSFEKGSIMLGDQSDCKGIPFIIKGTLRLFRVSENGREMTVYRIGTGELCVLAAVCVLGNLEYSYSVEAETDCRIAEVSPDTFKFLLQKEHAFKEYVFTVLADKLITSLQTIEMVNFTGIEQRLTQYLEQHADENGAIHTTHEKIAVELGSTREVISRQIKKLADQGCLVQKRGKIILNANRW